jgi:phosphatidate cytidylyltransferase
MKQRLITAGIGAVAFLGFLKLGQWWYSGLLFLLAAFAFIEFAQMKQFDWRQPPVLLGVTWIGFLFLIGLAHQDRIPYFSARAYPDPILLGLILFSVLIVFSRNHFHIFRMAYLWVGAIYIGYGFSIMMETVWRPDGTSFTLLILFITWAGDSGAYFTGKRWGKHKPWPEISPNKTLEGSIGGVLSAVLSSLILFQVMSVPGDLTRAIGLGILVAMVGQLGDLVESAWKRTMGVKDSGTILPGHGGILDRFDSLLFTFMVLRLLHMV